MLCCADSYPPSECELHQNMMVSGAGVDPGCVEGYRERDRYDQDVAANQGSVTPANTNPQESSRESRGEL